MVNLNLVDSAPVDEGLPASGLAYPRWLLALGIRGLVSGSWLGLSCV